MRGLLAAIILRHATLVVFAGCLSGTITFAITPPIVLARPSVEHSAAVVTDGAGRTVELSAVPARRVVILTQDLPIYVTLDEQANSIVGLSKLSRMYTRGSLLESIYPQLAVLPQGGSITEPEQLLFWRPDLVLAPTSPASDILQAIGIPGVVEVTVRSQHLEADILAAWSMLAIITAKQERKEDIVGRYRALLQALAAKPLIASKRVLVLWSFGQTWFGGDKGYYLNSILERVGITNVLGKRSLRQINVEEVMKKDPDVILLGPVGNTGRPSQLYASMLWKGVRAVNEKRVYIMPIHSFYNWPIDIPIVMTWLEELLGPQSAARDNRTRDLFSETYREVFHYEPTSEEIDRALWLRENMSSAHYSRFEAR
ncbi:MAG: hypothetical protein NTAFB05_08650 [Nitrobacter sp.]|uniref:ABC transporter substrate-binding protein n=1 Tax=Nitrobacter sp. TaxID=29420 RepID=UPI00387DFC7A